MTRKTLVIILLIAVLLLSLCGCGASAPTASGNGPSVVVTIFPLYDWVKELCRDIGDANVTLLMDSGVDMHSFQPSAAEIVQISTCDLFVYVGGESDAWVEDALTEAVNPNMVVVDLMGILGDKAVQEELTEGMTSEEEDDEAALDEHVWLSLRNAQIFCAAIGEALSELDPANASDYAVNTVAYCAELALLDEDYKDTVEAAVYDTLLFADRFPFRYLTDDYGLTYYAAFAGCSAETEASFDTIAFLSGKLAELRLPAVLVIDGSDGRIAETIADSAGVDIPILTLDSMQSITAQDISSGASYLTSMRQNLAVLEAALNG